MSAEMCESHAIKCPFLALVSTTKRAFTQDVCFQTNKPGKFTRTRSLTNSQSLVHYRRQAFTHKCLPPLTLKVFLFFFVPFFNMATGSDFVWYPIKQLAAIVDGQSDVMGCIVEKPSVGAFEWVFFGTTVECPATD